MLPIHVEFAYDQNPGAPLVLIVLIKYLEIPHSMMPAIIAVTAYDPMIDVPTSSW